MDTSQTIIVCECAERHLLDQRSLDGARRQAEAIAVPDLCGLAAKGDPVMRAWARRPALKIYACHPRAVRALFEHANAPLPDTAELVNMRSPSSESIPSPTPAAWPPWFPVIDKSRCRNCKQCLEFCLFGVYAEDKDGQIVVSNPDSCKNNCPACARICPEAAIIFPKFTEEPINGAEITDEEAVRENVKLNVNEILGDDIYATLNNRKQKRRRLLDSKKVQKALSEREKWRGASE